MDIKSLKHLAETYSAKELEDMASEFEELGTCPISTKEDAGEQLSDLLQAMEVRLLMDQGMTINEAVREFSKRVRSVLS